MVGGRPWTATGEDQQNPSDLWIGELSKDPRYGGAGRPWTTTGETTQRAVDPLLMLPQRR
jgi:hypothetical protein